MAKIEAVILSVGVTEGSSVMGLSEEEFNTLSQEEKDEANKRPQRYFSIAAQIMS